jgi:DNA-binding transcriptional regulator YiaG
MASTILGENQVASRIESLTMLKSVAASTDVSNDFGFQEILSRCQTILEMSDQQIADALLVSRPTVNRWIRGKNLPHRAMRKPIFEWICAQSSQRLRVLKGDDRKVPASRRTA